MEMSVPYTDPLASSIAVINILLMKVLMSFLTSFIMLRKHSVTRGFAAVQNKTKNV